MTSSVDLVRLLSSDAVSQARLSDRSGVVLDARALEAYAVNETGMCLVEAIRAGVSDRAGLIDRLVAEYEVDEETAGADIDGFVLELLEALGDRP